MYNLKVQIAFIAITISFVYANGLIEVPDGDNSSIKMYTNYTKECIHDEYRCGENYVQYCNHGNWTTTYCSEGTKCLGCSLWSCVAESEYTSQKEKYCVNEEKEHETCNTYKNATVVKPECIHDEYRCTDTSTSRCDHGVWIDYKCPVGTRCLGCGYWECIQESLWDNWREKICVEDQKECEKSNLHSYKDDTTTCEHGAFRCTNNSTDRCNFGKWYAYPCALGTKCLSCNNDFECVLENQFDELSKPCRQNETSSTKSYEQSQMQNAAYNSVNQLGVLLLLLVVGTVMTVFL